jgi:hypothetical protein
MLIHDFILILRKTSLFSVRFYSIAFIWSRFTATQLFIHPKNQSTMIRKITLIAMLMAITTIATAQPFQPNWESINSRPIPEWFQDVKYVW